MTIVYRAIKGSNLTANEVDGNFHDLDDRVVVLETTPPVPDELSSVSVSGDDITFHLVSGATLGPVTLNLPRWRDRGGFVAGDIYATNDTFTVDGTGLVVALLDHTAGLTFDEDASDTPVVAGNFIVGRIYKIATIGTTDFTTIGASANTVGLTFRATGVGTGTGTAGLKLYDVIIRAVDLTNATLDSLSDVTITSAASGDFVVWNGTAWTNRTTANARAVLDGLVRTETGIGSPALYTLVLSDLSSYIRVNNSIDVTITVPVEASVAFPIGTEIIFEQTGLGAVEVVGAIGVTINCAATHTPITNGQWAVAQIKKVATDEWTIFGNLVPA